MAERSEAPRDAARRIVESVLADRGESVLADRGESVLAERNESVLADRAGSGPTDVVVAPSTAVEPLDDGSPASAAADDPDDPRARARALVAEVLASRAALEAPAAPSPEAQPTPDVCAGAASSERDDTDPSRVRARELVAAALAEAERRDAEAEAERAQAQAERERVAAERARREAERERRVEAERRAAERRAAAERDAVTDDHDDPAERSPAPSERVPVAPTATDSDGEPEMAGGAEESPPPFTRPDPGTTVPLSVAELAASVGADATADVSAEETHALPRHRDEVEEPPAQTDAPRGEDTEATVAIATRPQSPPPPGHGAPAPQPVPADPPAPHEVAGPAPVEAAPPTTDAAGPAPVDAGPRPTGDASPEREPSDLPLETEASPSEPWAEPVRGGALEASVEVEPRERQRRTGRWLLTSVLGAIALAVLFPLAVDALRALVAL